MDRGVDPEPAVQTARSGADCLDESHFDFAAWGDGRPFRYQIADRMAGLTGEFDVYAEGAVDSLARTYLHFGFGREARQALQLDARRSSEREILSSLAAMVDDETPETDILARQFGCDGAAALWSALARDTILGAGEEERTAMVIAQRILPESIQSPIGLRLADLFLKAGDHVTASAILAPRLGKANESGVEVGMAEAEIARQAVGPAPAVNRLTAMVENGERMTANVMAELLTLSLAEGRAIDEATLLLSAALRFEERGTESAISLAVAELRNLIATDRFSQAHALIAGNPEHISSEVLADIETEFVVATAERMADEEFLNLAFGGLPEVLSDRSVNAVARRLITLGFPFEANGLLAAPATGEEMTERRYLRAEAAISLGRSAIALASLAGTSGPRADALRDQIRATGLIELQETLPGVESNESGIGLPLDVNTLDLVTDTDADRLLIPLPAQTLAARRLILEGAGRERALAEETLAAGLSDFGER